MSKKIKPQYKKTQNAKTGQYDKDVTIWRDIITDFNCMVKIKLCFYTSILYVVVDP